MADDISNNKNSNSVDEKIKEDPVYTDMKKRDFWTLYSGLAVINDTFFLFEHSSLCLMDFCDRILSDLDVQIFDKAIETGELKVKGYDYGKIVNWTYGSTRLYTNSHNKQFWHDCYLDLKVNPFEFLEFIKAKNLFDIPTELDFVKKNIESGNTQYFWVSEIHKAKEQKETSAKIKTESMNFQKKDNELIKFINMTKLDYWTLNEGVALLTNPFYYLDEFNRASFDKFDRPSFDEFANNVLCKINLEIFYRAIELGKLKASNYDQMQITNWDSKNSKSVRYNNKSYYHCCHAKLWRDCYGGLKIIPFEFIEFVKTKKLFHIPSEFEIKEITSESGKKQYCWASDVKNKQIEQNEKVIGKMLTKRGERTYLNIIGALLECLTGTFKDETFSSETKLREFIEEKFDDLKGVRARTLAEKFALAKKALNNEFE